MFKISTQKTYTWPINVEYPMDGGKYGKSTFTATFKQLPQSEIDALMKDSRDGADDTDAQLVSQVLIGWEGVADDAGSPLEFSPEALAALMEISYVRAPLIRCYFESISGSASRRKN